MLVFQAQGIRTWNKQERLVTEKAKTLEEKAKTALKQAESYKSDIRKTIRYAVVSGVQCWEINVKSRPALFL